MGDPLGSSRISSQKQKYEGVVRVQSGQYHATVESNPECGGGLSRDVTKLMVVRYSSQRSRFFRLQN